MLHGAILLKFVLMHKLNSLSSVPVIELLVSHSGFSNKYTKTPLQSAGKYLEAGHCPWISAPNCSPAGSGLRPCFSLTCFLGCGHRPTPQHHHSGQLPSLQTLWWRCGLVFPIALLKCWWPGKCCWWPPSSLIGKKIRKKYKKLQNYFKLFFLSISFLLSFCISVFLSQGPKYIWS